MFSYKPRGVCSTRIDLDIQDGIIRSCQFTGGCKGNLAGISQLIVGMPIDEVISRCKGIPCQGTTSCPDQLAHALEAYKASR